MYSYILHITQLHTKVCLSADILSIRGGNDNHSVHLVSRKASLYCVSDTRIVRTLVSKRTHRQCFRITTLVKYSNLVYNTLIPTNSRKLQSKRNNCNDKIVVIRLNTYLYIASVNNFGESSILLTYLECNTNLELQILQKNYIH